MHINAVFCIKFLRWAPWFLSLNACLWLINFAISEFFYVEYCKKNHNNPYNGAAINSRLNNLISMKGIFIIYRLKINQIGPFL